MSGQSQNALVLLLPSKAPRPDVWVPREKDSPQRLTSQELFAMALEHPGIPKAAA
jgi:hypothetical protein